MPTPQDIFLSYCWNDNLATEQLDEKREPLGWVAHLERQLAALVTMFRGVKTSVWRDATDLRGSSIAFPRASAPRPSAAAIGGGGFSISFARRSPPMR